ncbi:zinc ribbon domain-containing protein [Parathermosynechococcus lividus]
MKVGVAVKRVAPCYTSKTCHCCNVIGHRQGKRLACLNLSCGWIGDADVNGAKNMATLRGLVPPLEAPRYCLAHGRMLS